MNPIIETAQRMNISAKRVLRDMDADIAATERFIAKERAYSDDHRNHDLIAKYETHLANLKEARQFYQAAA